MSTAGLRERKKRATHQKIQDAALDLFARDGFAETTVAAIAEAADVAPRTVFTHFPAKEDLLFPHDRTFDGLKQRLETRPAGESTLDALRAWIADDLWLRDAEDDADPRQDLRRARTRREVIDADPALRQRERGQLDRVERMLAAAIAGDTGEAPTDLVPRMAASATVAVLTMLDRTLSADEHDPMTADAGLALVDQVVRFVNGGMAAVARD
jgi:AcrR family transcriptional regulator